MRALGIDDIFLQSAISAIQVICSSLALPQLKIEA